MKAWVATFWLFLALNLPALIVLFTILWRPDGRAWAARAAGWAWRAVQPAALTILGFGLIVTAVWVGWGAVPGLVSAGVAALLLEWRIRH